MLNKSSVFNYLTLILAICTICVAIWTIVTRSNTGFSVILMTFMLISYGISRKFNEDDSKLTKKDEEILNNLKIKRQSGGKVNGKKSSSNSR